MEQNFYPLLLVAGIITIVVIVFITRWLFRIDTIVKHHKAQTALLIKMARQQGVSADDIDNIKNTFNLN